MLAAQGLWLVGIAWEIMMQDKMRDQKQNIVGYILSFLIPLVLMVGVLIMQKSAPFGSASFLYADAYDQYYGMFYELLDWLSGDKSTMFLWNRGMGVDLYVNLLYYGMSVFNIIAIIFGKQHLDLAMTFIILLKMGAMSMTAYWFFIHTSRTKTMAEKPGLRSGIGLAGAVAYSLGNYVLAYNNNLMWFDGLILLPILAYCIEQLVKKGKWKGFVICLSAAMISNFYFAIYICFFCFFYFLLQNFGDVKGFVKASAKFAGFAIIAALTSGVALVPAFLAIMNRGNYDDSYSRALISPVGNLLSFFESFNITSRIDGLGDSMYTYNHFCGSLVILLVLFFFTNQKQSLWYRTKHGLVILFFVLAENTKVLGYVMHGFSYPHGLGNRFAILLVFLLLVVSAEAISQLESMSVKRLVVLLMPIMVSIVAGMLLNPENSYLFTLLLIIIYSAIAYSFGKGEVSLQTLQKWYVGLWIAELVINCVVVAPAKHLEQGFLQEIAYDAYEKQYENLQTHLGERKTSLYNRNFMGVSETNWYSSVLNGSMSDVFQSLGLSNYEVAEVTYRGTTPLTALLFNVRYVLSNEQGLWGGYHLVDVSPEEDAQLSKAIDMNLYEADQLAGMGFMVSNRVLEWKGNQSVFENQNDLWKKMIDDEASQSKLFSTVEANNHQEQVMFAEGVKRGATIFDYLAVTQMPPIFLISFQVPQEMDLYYWAKDTNCHSVAATVGDDSAVVSTYTDTATTAHVGSVQAGQDIQLQPISAATAGKKGLMEYQIGQFDNAYFYENLSKLTDELLVLDDMKGNTMTGHVEALADGILYLALPYNKGYQCQIDGNRVEVVKLGTGLMGVPVSGGKHEISLQYHTPGLAVGLGASGIGIVLILGVAFLGKRKGTHS